MFKPVKATSVAEYFDQLPEDRRQIMDFLHKFIRKTAPSLKPNFVYNMPGYGSFKYKNYKKENLDWPIIAIASQKNYDATIMELPPFDINPDKFGIKGWFNQSTPIIVALTEKRSYINNEFIVFPNVDLETRLTLLQEVIRFSKTGNANDVTNQLRENNITYILTPYDSEYLTKLQGVTKVYQVDTYTLYEVTQ